MFAGMKKSTLRIAAVFCWQLLGCLLIAAQATGAAAEGQQPATALPTAAPAEPAAPLQDASSAVPWHRDTAQALAASLISRRPVLIVFTATWSEASTSLQKATLVAPEAAALLTACFEPVRVDVDVDPSLTRSLGVSNIPTACIVDAKGQLLARFDCPIEPAAFVAAAGRAVQEAAMPRPAADLSAAVAPREQSDFVSQASQLSPASPVGGAAAAPVAQAPVAQAPAAQAPVAPAPSGPASTNDLLGDADPALPAAWPAESTAKPANVEGSRDSAGSLPAAQTTADASRRPLLEPAPASGIAPWLNGAGQQTAAASPVTPATQPAEAEAIPAKKNPASSFFAALQKPFSIFSKPKAPVVATQPGPGAPTAVPVGGATTAAAAVPDSYGSMPLGLEGYCPVTLVDKGSWVEGRAQWGARHRGRTYLFASAEQQKAFLADPDRYAPALSGDDPVLACDTGKQIAGQRRYGVTYQARTYLFSSPETRTAFTANPQRYTARVLLAEQTPDPSTTRR
jgi:YHS domain-containing protein